MLPVSFVATCRIGTHTHPMIILNYFACEVILAAACYISLSGRPWPSWVCLILVAICAFMMGLLLIAGVIYDNSTIVMFKNCIFPAC